MVFYTCPSETRDGEAQAPQRLRRCSLKIQAAGHGAPRKRAPARPRERVNLGTGYHLVKSKFSFPLT